jgi:transformer-2 protein
MFDPHTKESRGFAFVTMNTTEDADAAIAALNGTDLQGKTMRVEKVRFLSLLPPMLTRS